mgnify:CR=1 FL=1
MLFRSVNVSSPNTEKLRDLQGRAALTALLRGVMDTRATLSAPLPVFLKIAPDLTDDDIADIAAAASETGIDGIIATNTTLSRDGLSSPHRSQTGGLSGAPLFEKSTRILARLSHLTHGALPLIGVGGISTPEQAYAKSAPEPRPCNSTPPWSTTASASQPKSPRASTASSPVTALPRWPKPQARAAPTGSDPASSVFKYPRG